MKRWIGLSLAALVTLGVATQLPGCAASRGGAGSAAQKVYVKPGEHDAYYAFLSGGHSGQVFVYGMPSCRYITTIPVFTPEPAKGYGVDEESKAMLKGFTWGDAHHPHRSQGLHDARDLRTDPEPVRGARVPVPDPEHRVRVRGIAVLGADSD